MSEKIRNIESDAQAIENDWQAVGEFLLQAMQEVAMELGGQELRDKVTVAAKFEGGLPNIEALIILEEASPGIGERVMARSEEIQKQSHRADIRKCARRAINSIGDF